MTPLIRLAPLWLAAGLCGQTAFAQAQPSSLTVAASQGPAEFATTPATAQTLAQLRKGGLVLYMRHGTTDNSRPDQPDLKLDDCNTQRPLNDEGRAVAVKVGQALAKARIPVGDIWVSPLCRTRETAQLAFGNRFQVEPMLIYTAHLTTAQKQPVLEQTRKLLSTPVPDGTNRMLVAHAPNMADLMGYFVKPEGTVVVIEPLGDGQFRYLASIPPDLWPKLLR